LFLLHHLFTDPFSFELYLLKDTFMTVYERDYIKYKITNNTDHILNIVISVRLIIKNEIQEEHAETYKIILNPRYEHSDGYYYISYISTEYGLNSTSYSHNAQPLKILAEAHFTDKWYKVKKLKKSILSLWAFWPHPPEKKFIRLK